MTGNVGKGKMMIRRAGPFGRAAVASLFFFLSVGSAANSASMGGPGPDAKRLRSIIEKMAGFESRVLGYPGAEKAAEYLLAEFEKIGLEDVRVETFSRPMPIEKFAELRVPELGRNMRLHCFWPNLTRLPNLPREGVNGALLYSGAGKHKAGSNALVRWLWLSWSSSPPSRSYSDATEAT